MHTGREFRKHDGEIVFSYLLGAKFSLEVGLVLFKIGAERVVFAVPYLMGK
jgi:hypothetical protein